MSDRDETTERYIEHLFWFDKQQALYKEQLAEALIAFNRIENFVSEMISTILHHKNREELRTKLVNKQFAGRCEALELLLLTVPGAPRLPMDRLSALAGRRNDFAHGHFSADADTGEMVLLGKGKATPWREHDAILFLEECAAVRYELNRIFAYVLFGGPPPEQLFPDINKE